MDDFKWRVTKSSRDCNWSFGLKLGAALCTCLLVLQMLISSRGTASLKSWSCKNGMYYEETEQKGDAGHSANVIPNLVHFVYLVQRPSELNFQFSLRHFIAIYSASHFLNPETLYIHTNLDQDIVDNVWDKSNDPYLQAMRQLPNIKFNRHLAPNKTSAGKAIDKLPNQSDFVRTDVLKKYGGVYLDDDAYVLRDLRPLRHIGFEMVTGQQHGGSLCPAVILSTPQNAMITAYHALQDRIFDGEWATHATKLLNALAHDFADTEFMSLVMPQDSFFPGSWLKKDLQWIYQQHDKDASEYNPKHTNPPTANLTHFISNFELDPEIGDPHGGSEEKHWHDWSLSYVLHGWTSGIRSSYGEKGKKDLFGTYEDITLDYILSRKSNFARAVYPAVKHALDSGVLSSFPDLMVLNESSTDNGRR